MTNVEALKEVYTALGGSAEDFTATTNDEAIALIASVAGGGSGGGKGVLVAHYADEMNNNNFTAKTTFAEIQEAIQNDILVVALIESSVNPKWILMTEAETYGDNKVFVYEDSFKLSVGQTAGQCPMERTMIQHYEDDRVVVSTQQVTFVTAS